MSDFNAVLPEDLTIGVYVYIYIYLSIYYIQVILFCF